MVVIPSRVFARPLIPSVILALNSVLFEVCFYVVNTHPVIAGASRSDIECSDEYDMGSSWYQDFMTVMYVILGVLAVCVVVLVIFVIVKPGKKNMKKESAV